MTAVVLHLSDIHIKNQHDPILARATEIASCAYTYLPEATTVFVVVSGDVVFSGEATQYECAEKFLLEIRRLLVDYKELPVHFVVCPGNHDCNFESSTESRNLILGALNSTEASRIDSSVIETCCAVQSDYFAFEEKLNENYKNAGDKLWKTITYEVEGKEITFDCINVAWMSKIQEELGTIQFPYERYIKSQADSSELRIGLIHHPYHWLNQSIYRQFRKALRQREHLVISGHEHIGNVGENFDTESGQSAYIEGCVLQGESNLSDSAFNVAVFELTDGTYRSTQYKWIGTSYTASEEGSWEDYRNIPIKSRSPLDIQPGFRDLLVDPGASFNKLSGYEITLSDIYVFPDLSSKTNSDESRRIVSSQILTDPSRLIGGVLLVGEERVGATSLLYQLFEKYYDRGLVPLYVRGKDIGGAKAKDIDAAIRRAVIEQYGPQAVTKFYQLPKGKKTLLLDDFDECRLVATSFRASVVSGLAQRFESMIVTVGELFDVQEAMVGDGEDGLDLPPLAVPVIRQEVRLQG